MRKEKKKQVSDVATANSLDNCEQTVLYSDLYCVEWGVKLYSNQPTNPADATATHCLSKIQIVFTFLVPADPGSPGQRAVKRVCVCVCVCV